MDKTKTDFVTAEEILSQSHVLILHNDDINDINHVVTCLIICCGHQPMQAQQCASIAHNNGKVDIKYGDFDDLYEMHKSLEANDLTTTLEKNN